MQYEFISPQRGVPKPPALQLHLTFRHHLREVAKFCQESIKPKCFGLEDNVELLQFILIVLNLMLIFAIVAEILVHLVSIRRNI